MYLVHLLVLVICVIVRTNNAFCARNNDVGLNMSMLNTSLSYNKLYITEKDINY